MSKLHRLVKWFHSFLQGWKPTPTLHHYWVNPLSEVNLKNPPPPSSLFLGALQIGTCKLYETLKNEGVTFRTILSQLRRSLSLLFIFSGSTLYLILSLWLDIAFNVIRIWHLRGINMKHFLISRIKKRKKLTYQLWKQTKYLTSDSI